MLKLARAAICSTVSLIAVMGAAFAIEYHEAPGLADAVAAGTLPPVAERLPVDPEVITPLTEVGTYGGALRFGLRGSSDHNHIIRFTSNQGLVRWDPSGTQIIPNLATSWEIDPEGKVFTFHLREGLKWSDGQPFGADDVLFNVNDLLLNNDWAPTPARYTAGGAPLSVEKIDDLTVQFTFAAPYGDFLKLLATPLGQNPVIYAKHYCSQFLPQYNDKIDELIAENQAGDWQALFLSKCGDLETPLRWGNVDRPTMDPWVITSPYVGSATQVVLSRNPYFWQVDTEGNQLPYIDQLTADVAQDVESLILSIIGGKIDFALRHVDGAANRPVFAENQERGNYHFFEATPGGGTNMVFLLNLNHKNPELRELFNTHDFRVALSVGIDRQEIIDTAMLGQGEPWQGGDFPGYPYANERFSTQFLEYDPEQANALLDEIGLTRGPDGVRMLPSGKPLKIVVDVVPTLTPEWIDILEIMEQQYTDIGIDIDVNPMERTLFFERAAIAYDHDAAVWAASGNSLLNLPEFVVPMKVDNLWATAWGQWYNSNGANGEEPPEDMKERLALWDAARATPDDAEKLSLRQEMLERAADAFEMFGISKALPSYGIVSNRLVNVPESMPHSWDWVTPGPALPQSWYFKD